MNRFLSLVCIGLGMAAGAAPRVVSLNGTWSFSAGGRPGESHALVLDDINDEYHFEIRRPTGDVCVKY